SVMLQGEEELKRAPQPRLALEVLLLRLIHLEPLTPLSEWLHRLDALEQRLEAGPGSAAATKEPRPVPVILKETAPAVSPPDSPGEAGLQDQWQAFLSFVQEKENGPLSGRLAQSRLVDRSDHDLKIALGRAWNAAGPRHEARLRALARTFFGPDTSLTLETEAPQAARKSPAAGRKPQDLKKIRQQALEIFGGEWVGAVPGKEEPE
ncbi:MAG TPA: hypothetical protein VE082_02960, partial [Desulfobaccales bacterium]|nr:hypothetical protein [Desulfobaccales bacterium]